MGIFKSLFDSKTVGENIVKTQVMMYNKFVDKYPNKGPHFYLANVWLSRMASRFKNMSDSDLEMLSYTETYSFSCVPVPNCARALGLYFLYKERPDILDKYDQFKD